MLLDGSEMDSFADLTHTPQGDVKNEAMFSLLPKFKNLTHTPQGDVKAFPLITTWWSSRFNSPPARGRKPIPVDKDDNQAFGFNSHPARGRKFRLSLLAKPTFDLTHTPQGDGKLALFSYSILQPQDLTHTPQGDGMHTCLIQFQEICRFDSRPARGRNDRHLVIDLAFRMI